LFDGDKILFDSARESRVNLNNQAPEIYPIPKLIGENHIWLVKSSPPGARGFDNFHGFGKKQLKIDAGEKLSKLEKFTR
jgi:hypothetical protein